MSSISTRLRPARLVVLTLALGGCAMPGWVPWIGKSAPKGGPAPAAANADATAEKRDGDKAAAEKETPKLFDPDDPVTDRVVAVVNSDAITLNEVIESVVAWRQENQGRSVSDEEVARDFLSRLIDMRLQLQEAEREKIVVDDVEVEEELADRMKKLPGQATKQDFEAAIQAQGLTMDMVRKRLRDSLRLSKVIRRKVTLRVTVNDNEIDRYLEQNRPKLETGLSYHARHLLVVPDSVEAPDAEWEKARIRAELLRSQILAGADFAEVARQRSADASARDGGDLGTLKRGELAADIEAEILKLEPGQISTPYRSTLGYHLFRLESKEVLEGDAMVRARQQIRDILFREKYESRLAAWLREIKQRAIIDVRL